MKRLAQAIILITAVFITRDPLALLSIGFILWALDNAPGWLKEE